MLCTESPKGLVCITRVFTVWQLFFFLMYLKGYSVFVILGLAIGKMLLEVITAFKFQFHYLSRESLKLEFLQVHSSFYNLD